MAQQPRRITPRRCIESNPRHNTVLLNGKYISLTALSELLGWEDNSYLSLIFAGKRQPSLDKFKSIADALMMDMDALQEGIKDRVSDLEEKKVLD